MDPVEWTLTLTRSPSDGAREYGSPRGGMLLNGEPKGTREKLLLLTFRKGRRPDEGNGSQAPVYRWH